MSLYAISDLHLSLKGEKPMDIFPGWEGYLQKLQTNWERVVTPEDTVALAGDLSWAMRLEDTEADFAFLDALPGKKLLLKGNHDLWWATRRKMEAFFAGKGWGSLRIVHNGCAPCGRYAVCGTRGWSRVEDAADRKILLREVGRLEASLAAADAAGLEPLVFLHYPPALRGQICREILDVLHAHGVTRCYFGHLHGGAARAALLPEYEGIRMTLLSADALNFSPMLIERM